MRVNTFIASMALVTASVSLTAKAAGGTDALVSVVEGQCVYTVLADGTASVALDSAYTETVTAVSIPDSVTIEGTSYAVTTIADNGFSGCPSLAEVTLPSTLTVIGNTAFYHCPRLSAIDLPDGLLTIGEGAFCAYNGAGLTSVSLPASVEEVGYRAFYNAPLTDLVIEGDSASPSLTIGSEAFNGTAIPLSEIHIGRAVPPVLADDTFNSSEYRTTKLYFYGAGAGHERAYVEAPGWKNFISLVVTGVSSPEAAQTSAAEAYYTIGGAYAGADASALAPGLYITRGAVTIVSR